MKRFLILIPLLAQLQGCNSANAESPIPQMDYDVLHEAQYNEFANYTSKSSIIIRNQSDYESELIKRTSETVKLVNFESESVVLIDMGTQSSSGYTVSFSFQENSDHIKASIVYNFPDQSCNVATAITNPYQFVRLETTKYILVSEDIVFSSC